MVLDSEVRDLQSRLGRVHSAALLSKGLGREFHDAVDGPTISIAWWTHLNAIDLPSKFGVQPAKATRDATVGTPRRVRL
jgi:hypothetical protein